MQWHLCFIWRTQHTTCGGKCRNETDHKLDECCPHNSYGCYDIPVYLLISMVSSTNCQITFLYILDVFYVVYTTLYQKCKICPLITTGELLLLFRKQASVFIKSIRKIYIDTDYNILTVYYFYLKHISISIHSFTDSERLIGTQPSSAIQLIVSHTSNKMIRYFTHMLYLTSV